MHTEHDNKINGGGDSAVDKVTIEKQVFSAIMELPKDSWKKVLGKYFEKYEMEEIE